MFLSLLPSIYATAVSVTMHLLLSTIITTVMPQLPSAAIPSAMYALPSTPIIPAGPPLITLQYYQQSNFKPLSRYCIPFHSIHLPAEAGICKLPGSKGMECSYYQ
ncbi:hypothetical protein XELAEV_18002169mg, partial [Xenopus laevis]